MYVRGHHVLVPGICFLVPWWLIVAISMVVLVCQTPALWPYCRMGMIHSFGLFPLNLFDSSGFYAPHDKSEE
eukprot:jgi/Chrzof1/10334/Cz04g38080.t1